MENNYQKNYNTTILRKINLFCCFYICVWNILPVFRSFTNQGVFRVVFFAIVTIWISSSLMISRKWFYELLSISVLGSIYIVIMILYYLFGHGDMSLTKIIDPVLIFLYMYMGYFYFMNSSSKTIKRIVGLICILFIITALTTSYNLTLNINVSRLLTSSSTSQEIVNQLERRNIAAFDFIYGVVILIPTFFVGLKIMKNNRRNSIVFIFGLFINILAISVIALSNFMIAYFLLIVGILLSLFINQKRTYLIVLSLLILSIVLYPLIFYILIFILDFIKDRTPSIMTQIKINNIIDVLRGNSDISTISIRLELILNSIKSFFSAPLAGVGAYYHNSSIIGNHSQIIDDLGRYGVIGTIPILAFIISVPAKVIKRIKNRLIRKGYLYSFLLFLILSLFNPTQSYGIMFSVFFVLPIVTRFYEDNYNKTEKKMEGFAK